MEMTNKSKSRVTRRKLLISFVSLMLCLSVLLGSTFAWFVDSVESRANTIQTGNLAMEISYKPYGSEYTEWTKIGPETKIFNENALCEPGYTEAIWLKVENKGNLAFKYLVDLEVYEELPGINHRDDRFNLSDYLKLLFGLYTSDYKSVENSYSTREYLMSNFSWSGEMLNGSKVIVAKDRGLYSNNDSTEYICVILHMPQSVGNVANHNGEYVPQVKLGLNASATQMSHEEDSFGNNYDSNAEYMDTIHDNREEKQDD